MINKVQLLEMAKEMIGVDFLTLETNRDDVEEWDSLIHVMLVAAVAENYGVVVPADEISNITCLMDFMKYEK